MIDREAERLLIARKETMSWITKEINFIVKNFHLYKRYNKARHEGYLSALKKVQARLDSLA